MALVRQITPIVKERQTLHAETACCSSVLIDDRGNRFIQLDTYGSKTRKLEGKVSQAIQFDEQAAKELKLPIEQTFPHLR